MSRYEDNKQDQEFSATAIEMLRESADHLDAATASRLNRARQHALSELPSSGRLQLPGREWLLTGAAAIALVAVLLWPGGAPGPSIESTPAAPVADEAVDFELLLDEESLEMLAELDFFAGLSEEDLAEVTG
jgi:hypothetical protein